MYLPALDGLRAVSILLVLAAHGGLERIVPGGLGVTIFFFVSGYLITGQLAREHAKHGRISWGGFYARRAIRLMPAALGYVAIAGGAFVALGGRISAGAWLASVFYGSNYAAVFTRTLDSALPGVPHPFTILWSLAVEEHFYFVWPAALALLLARGRAATLAALLLVVVGELAWRAHLAPLCDGHAAAHHGLCGFHPDDRIYKTTDTRLDSLAFGAIAAITGRTRFARPVIAGAVALLAASLAARSPLARDTWRCTAQGVSLLVLVPALIHGGEGPVRRVLGSLPLRTIGRLSYGLYLWHWLALMLAARFAPHGVRFVLCFTGLTTVLAVASWFGLEQPFLALRRRLGSHAPPLLPAMRMPSRMEGLARKLGTLLAGSAGGQAAALATAPLLARLYGLHAFGLYAVLAAATALAASIASLGVESAILLSRDPAERNDAYGASVLVALFVAAIATLIGLAWPLPGCPRSLMLLLGPSVFALGVGRAAANQALALDRHRAVATGRFLRSAGAGVVQLALAVAAPTALSLAAGAVIGQALAAVATVAMIGRAGLPRLPSRANLRELAWRHQALLRWSAPQTLLNAFGNAVVPILVARCFGADAAGCFALANRVVQIPAATIGEALRQTLLSTMARQANDESALLATTRRWSGGLLLGLGAATVLFAAIAEPLFALVFGPRWENAGVIASLLLAAEMAGISNIPAVTAIVVRMWQRELFAFQAAQLPFRVGAILLATTATDAIAAWSALSFLGSLTVSGFVLRRLGRDGTSLSLAKEQPA